MMVMVCDFVEWEVLFAEIAVKLCYENIKNQIFVQIYN